MYFLTCMSPLMNGYPVLSVQQALDLLINPSHFHPLNLKQPTSQALSSAISFPRALTTEPSHRNEWLSAAAPISSHPLPPTCMLHVNRWEGPPWTFSKLKAEAATPPRTLILAGTCAPAEEEAPTAHPAPCHCTNMNHSCGLSAVINLRGAVLSAAAGTPEDIFLTYYFFGCSAPQPGLSHRPHRSGGNGTVPIQSRRSTSCAG